MNVYCGIQLQLQITQLSADTGFSQRTMPQQRKRAFLFLKAETGQGHGTLQGMVTQTGMSSSFWSLLPLLYSLQFFIGYLNLRRQRLCQLYLSSPLFVISVSYNEGKRDWPSLHSPQQLEVRKSRHPSPLFPYLAISLKKNPSLPCCLTSDSHANL